MYIYIAVLAQYTSRIGAYLGVLGQEEGRGWVGGLKRG